ncbi:MAG: hypothetical protein ACOYZ7_14615 [Chloroflexota bacterium]
MNDPNNVFRFPLVRVLPLVASFAFLLLIIVGGIVVGGYHPIVTALLWLGLIGSAWFALSDLVSRAEVRDDGLKVQALSLRGIQTHLLPWSEIQELNLSGHMPDALQLLSRSAVSTGKVKKWTLPAHVALAESVVRQASLQPDRQNRPPGVNGAFDTLLQTRGKRKKYGLFWRWMRMERERENE